MKRNDVLVVDDDQALNMLFCYLVEMAGFEARSALDGATALLAAQTQPPKLILLDLMLPDMSGFDVCTALKNDERTRSSTIVMVTALSDLPNRERGMACGAVDYLVKTLDVEPLVEAIKKHAA